MTQILREQGPLAALRAIQELVRGLTPPDRRPPVDPWNRCAETMCFRAVPVWRERAVGAPTIAFPRPAFA